MESDPGLALNLGQTRRFHYLYQRASADLARLATFASEPEMGRYLESLVARAYGEIHETRDQRIVGAETLPNRDRLEAGTVEGVDERVLAAMDKVPRHRFVPSSEVRAAYANRPLAIGHGQTISQPFIVALMTQTLLDRGRQRVLEIGTGSGYQTAVLAALVKRVFTVERIAPLIERARERFRAMKLRNVRVKYDDGNMGWPEQGPFDGRSNHPPAILGMPRKCSRQISNLLAGHSQRGCGAGA
jgi:protein-L-isoaspartate(D-aspartate) O-methyltransferase